jgi:hypothetical protein
MEVRVDLHKHSYSVHDRGVSKFHHLNDCICILLCFLSELNTRVETEKDVGEMEFLMRLAVIFNDTFVVPLKKGHILVCYLCE